ncbi:MAG: endonuclease/exonuclease/phosphatase family protein [Nitrosomonas sp.]|nr:endonuclease/exonuclease/phosphatase family protein [Nitrosomonas sp.]
MRLLSWNIQWGRGIDGRVDLPRIVETIHQLGDFDVVCLQEVAINFPGLPGSLGEDQVAELSSGFPGYTAVYGAGTDVPAQQGNRSLFGNVIFSRFPVGQVWRHLLPWSVEFSSSGMQRVLIEINIETDIADIGSLRIMTTHLEYYSEHQRRIQIEAIRNLHRQACKLSQRQPLPEERGSPFEVFHSSSQAILCGDMNFPTRSPEYSQILAPFFDATPNFYDSWKILNPGKPNAPTVGIHPVDFVDQPECFDYVFITEGLVNRLKTHNIEEKTAASDHQPVWIELSSL